MNNKLIGIEVFAKGDKRGVIKRYVYKLSSTWEFLEKAEDNYPPFVSLVDMDIQLPPKHIAIEKVEIFNDEQGYYMVYYIIIYNGIVAIEVNLFMFSEVEYPGYDDTQLKRYLEGFIAGIKATKPHHNT